ncbi:MAG TPA: hypothetical protein VMY05_00200 [Acidobacteriota bacterium]|nr:hypothetical protein [Acidobacteriota bacterium]
MSYTNADQVRHHLVARFPIQGRVSNQAVVIRSDDYISFYGGAVDQSSLVVKSLQANEPTRVDVTLGAGRNALGTSPLVPGSVVVASDSSLGTVYVENADYVVDYETGELMIKDGGSLSAGQDVTAWCIAYREYTAGADYEVRADRGEIRRLAAGDIAGGETLWLDYSPVYQTFDDEVVNNAVITANGLVEREVDKDRQFGADPMLVTAATYRALEVVCRTSAVRELSGTDSGDRKALAWMKLAEEYAAEAARLLRSFRPPGMNASAPRRA